MATFDYNPITGNLDLVGSGASYIDGVVADSSLLPVTLGTPPLDAVYLAKAGSGVWLINRKPAGLYCRVANNGNANDWQHLGSFPEVNSSANWELYDGSDPTKELKFNLSGISTGTTRTLTVPNNSGTITLNSDLAAIATSGSASDLTSGTLDNARINFAAPSAIGSTTPSTGAFTTLSTAPAANTSALTSTGYSLTGSSAQSLVDLDGTWNTTGVPNAIRLNITNTASNSASRLLNLQVGGSSVFNISTNGTARFDNAVGTIIFSSTGSRGISWGSNSHFWCEGDEVYYFGRGLGGSRRVGIVDGVVIYDNATFAWANAGQASNTRDLFLARDSSNTLAQRNSTNAQESRLYGTFTSSTNYQRMTVKSVRQTLSALSGASATTTGTFIPDGAVVVGVTTRVSTALTGATGYQVGDGTDADRWGDITGTAIGTTSDNRDWTAGTIECFTAGGEITLTAKTSNFTAGAIEICVFYLAGQAD